MPALGVVEGRFALLTTSKGLPIPRTRWSDIRRTDTRLIETTSAHLPSSSILAPHTGAPHMARFRFGGSAYGNRSATQLGFMRFRGSQIALNSRNA